MTYRKYALENRVPKRAEREWKIFENTGALSEWMHALAHQRVSVCIIERHITPVCVRVLVEYC